MMEVTIERILPGGLGLAHADGKTVMVSLAAPGDRLRVRVDRMKGNVVFASIDQIIEPSSQRIEPPCPYFGRCGGCDFQQLTYEAQLNAKAEMVKDCLHRIGGIADVSNVEIVAAPNSWHYRARAQWQFDAEGKRLGYFESGSRRVCDVAECAVLVPELQNTLAALRARMAEGALPPDSRYFRAIAGDNAVSVDPHVSDLSTYNHPTQIQRSVHGESYTLNAESFFQTNVDLLPKLIDHALHNAGGETALELYCGVGPFTVPLGRRFKRVIGVEENREAAECARRNLGNARLPHVEIANVDVGRWLDANLKSSGVKSGRGKRRRSGSLRKLQDTGSAREEISEASIQSAEGVDTLQNAGPLQNGPGTAPVELLLLDPPRTGAESRVIAGILQIKPKRIVYVSCDPATLARDLKKLIAGGFSIDSVLAFDMFPQTHHVETVVHLSS